jgi:RHS repeat-associated protein
VTNALGVADTYTFSTLQGVPKVTGISRAATGNTAAATESFSYDSNGYQDDRTDWNGNETKLTNNSHGLPTEIDEAYGSTVARTTTIAYDSTWVHLPDTITTTGLTTTFAYDSSGNVHTRTETDTTSTSTPYSTNGTARTWTMTYSSTGQLESVTGPRTDVTQETQLGYTGGVLTSITDALSHVTTINTYTAGGLPTEITDPNGVVTTFTYDGRQRLLTRTLGAATDTYTVDPTGEITEISPADGHYRLYAYDNAHRLTKITSGYNDYIQYTLDALGGHTQQENFWYTGGTEKLLHNATFDNLGRKLTDVAWQDGTHSMTTTYSYDNDGNRLTIEDPLSNQTTRVFDALNRLSQSTDANSGVVQWTYDDHDRPLTVKDQNGNTTSYVYDGFGDVIQQSSPDTGTTVYHYDLAGNTTSKTDALGVVTDQTFDALNRVLTTTYPADSALNVAYTYDQTGTGFSYGIGRLTSLTDQAGSLTRAYDSAGNLLTEKRTNSGNTYTTSYTYDQDHKELSSTYPDGTVVTYTYDTPGSVYIVKATPAGGTQTTIAPNVNHMRPWGPLRYISFGNGMTETWWPDLDWRMTAISGNIGPVTDPHVMLFDYAYDNANNLTTITDQVNAANSQTMTYDVLNRLHTATSGTGGYGSYTYGFDPVGNLTSLTLGSTTTTYSYATGTNQLSAIGSSSVSTNANGNITGIPIVGGSSNATFSYSKANRLSAASGGGISTAITGMAYDAFGQRFSKSYTSGSPTLYFYDQKGEVIAENIGGTWTDYAYVDGIPLAIIVPTASPAADQINYVLTDRLGTPQQVWNSASTVAEVWSNTYQPFGQGGVPTSGIVNDIRLPGQTYDPETGFHYNLFRDYMPNLGRYLESDPVGLAGGTTNTYAYANDNPFKWTDRRGLCPGDREKCEQNYLHSTFGDWATNNIISNFSPLSLIPGNPNFWNAAWTSGESAFVKGTLGYGGGVLGRWLINNGYALSGSLLAGASGIGVQFVVGAVSGLTGFATTADYFAYLNCMNLEP